MVTLVLPDQRRDVARLMSDAGIRPQVTQVRSGEAELSRITGARTPSGVPVAGAAPSTERSAKGNGSTPHRRRGSKPPQGRRSNADTATAAARAAAAQRRANRAG